MRHLIHLVTVYLLFGFGNSPGHEGIEFYRGSLAEAFVLSKQTGKPIFIDVYASWCGPCKQLKRTSFKDKVVGNYYNKNFICVAINGEKGEGPEMMRYYRVNAYPTLLIVNGEGKLLARATGFMEPYILVNFGRRVVP